MKLRAVILLIVPWVVMAPGRLARGREEPPIVTGFHHVHMNVVDPASSQRFYVTHVQSKPVTVAGWMGVQNEDLYILFNKVAAQASNEWDSAIWHFGWNS